MEAFCTFVTRILNISTQARAAPNLTIPRTGGGLTILSDCVYVVRGRGRDIGIALPPLAAVVASPDRRRGCDSSGRLQRPDRRVETDQSRWRSLHRSRAVAHASGSDSRALPGPDGPAASSDGVGVFRGLLRCPGSTVKSARAEIFFRVGTHWGAASNGDTSGIGAPKTATSLTQGCSLGQSQQLAKPAETRGFLLRPGLEVAEFLKAAGLANLAQGLSQRIALAHDLEDTIRRGTCRR